MGGGEGPEYTIEGVLSCSHCTFPVRLEGTNGAATSPWTEGFIDIHKDKPSFTLRIRGKEGAIESTTLRLYDLAGNTSTDGLAPLLEGQIVPVSEQSSTRIRIDLDANA